MNKQENKNILELFQSRQSSIHRFSDLHTFRQQLESPTLLPYTANKHKVTIYRMIFFTLAALFLFLATFIFFRNLTWACHLVIGHCVAVKHAICIFCGALSFAAFGIGFQLSAEREAANHLVHVAKQRLHKMYSRKRVEHGLTHFLLVGSDHTKHVALQQLYCDAKDKLHECKEELISLLKRIRHATHLDPSTKENLLNQAILEFNEHLDSVLHKFLHTKHLEYAS